MRDIKKTNCHYTVFHGLNPIFRWLYDTIFIGSKNKNPWKLTAVCNKFQTWILNTSNLICRTLCSINLICKRVDWTERKTYQIWSIQYSCLKFVMHSFQFSLIFVFKTDNYCIVEPSEDWVQPMKHCCLLLISLIYICLLRS